MSLPKPIVNGDLAYLAFVARLESDLAGGEALQTLRAKCQAWAPKLELAIPADDADVLAVAGEMRDVAAAIAKNAKDTIIMHRGTLQGLARTDKPAFCFQGHPEASPGPHDISYLFERFVALMEKN